MTAQTKNAAVLAKEEGIQRAVDHADKVIEGWSDEAYRFLKTFLIHKSEFLTEDVREAANGIVPEPPSLKAWGGVITRATKDGLITSIGFRKAKHVRSHQRPSTLWRRIKP
jgi:hypothetical protein